GGEAATRRRLGNLADRRLLSFDAGTVELHDEQRAYLVLYTPDARVRHADLLDAYRPLLSDRRAPWRELPRNEPYIWRHLLWHLRVAGDAQAARGTVSDAAFLAVLSFLAGPYAVEAELRDSAAWLGDADGTLGWLQRLFARWGHTLRTC